MFKVKQQRYPIESIVVAHSLELVYIEWLCLEPGKGKEQSILVVTYHFSQNVQVYIMW